METVQSHETIARRSSRFLFGSCSGTFVLFGLTGTAVLLLSVGLLSFAEEIRTLQSNTTTAVDERSSFGALLFESYTLFIDPGTQTGEQYVEQFHGTFRLSVVIFSSLCGFVWVLMAFGALVDRLGVALHDSRRRHAMIVARDHIVILGWTGKTLFLLRELAQMLSDGEQGGGTIVILGDLETEDMREEVRVVYRDFRAKWPRVRIAFWRGNPFEVDHLERVSAGRARHVLVLGASRQPREADSLVISTLCALQCVPGRRTGASIVVEVAMPQNVEVAQQLGGSSAHIITPAAAIDELLVLSMRSALVGGSLIGLMTFEGDQFEVVSAAKVVAEAQRAGVPCTFGFARRRFAKGVVIGVRHTHTHATDDSSTPDAQEGAMPLRMGALVDMQSNRAALLKRTQTPPPQLKIQKSLRGLLKSAAVTDRDLLARARSDRDGDALRTAATDELKRTNLAPRDDHELCKSDELVVISRTHKDAQGLYSTAQMQMLDNGAPAAASHRGRRERGRSPWSAKRDDQVEENHANENDETPTPPRDPIEPPDTVAPAVARRAAKVTLTAPAAVEVAASTRNAYLLIGWVHGIHSLLRALDRRVPPGSEVVILSEKPLAWRDAELAVEGLNLYGERLVDDDGGGIAPAPSASRRGPRGDSAVDGATRALHNIRLKHFVGFPTDEAAIRRLPLRRAVAAIVSADVDTNDVDTQITDSEVITSAHLLRRVYEPLAAAEVARVGPMQPLSLVVEFNDVLTKRLLEIQPGLLAPPKAEGASQLIDVVVFHRNYLETAALAISTHLISSWFMLRRLLSARGGVDLLSIPVGAVLDGPELQSDADGAVPTPFNFHELSSRVSQRGHGVLLGWQRHGAVLAANETGAARTINPNDKLTRRTWRAHDMLIVVERVDEDAGIEQTSLQA